MKKIIKIIGITVLSLLINDLTAFMESINESSENNESNKSFQDYFYKYQFEIFTTLGVSLVIIILLIKFDIILNIPIEGTMIDHLMMGLQNITNDQIYNEIITLITDKNITVEECVKILTKMLTYKDYPSLVTNPEEFNKIMKNLIDEIKKK